MIIALLQVLIPNRGRIELLITIVTEEKTSWSSSSGGTVIKGFVINYILHIKEIGVLTTKEIRANLIIVILTIMVWRSVLLRRIHYV